MTPPGDKAGLPTDNELSDLQRVALGVLCRLGVPRHHVDDLVQQVLLDLVIALRQGRIRDPPNRTVLRAWVGVVAARQAYWYRRKARRDAAVFVTCDVDQLPGPHPDGRLDAREELRRIERRLRPKQLDRLLADVSGEDPGVGRAAISSYRMKARGRRR